MPNMALESALGDKQLAASQTLFVSDISELIHYSGGKRMQAFQLLIAKVTKLESNTPGDI